MYFKHLEYQILIRDKISTLQLQAHLPFHQYLIFCSWASLPWYCLGQRGPQLYQLLLYEIHRGDPLRRTESNNEAVHLDSGDFHSKLLLAGLAYPQNYPSTLGGVDKHNDGVGLNDVDNVGYLTFLDRKELVSVVYYELSRASFHLQSHCKGRTKSKYYSTWLCYITDCETPKMSSWTFCHSSTLVCS